MRSIDYATRRLDSKSVVELRDVDHRLAAIVFLAADTYSSATGLVLRVTDGRRTREEQEALFAAKKTWTMNSRHLDGGAVDLAILTANRKEALWDLPLYRQLNEHMQKAASVVLGTWQALTWGGKWKQVDAVHWELNLPSI